MHRSPSIVLITALLAVYGIYAATLAVPALIAGTAALLATLLLAEAVLAFAGAVGAWSRARWAGAVVILLGVLIAARSLVDSFVLGITAYLYALLVALVAIVVALLMAAELKRRRFVIPRVL